MAAAASGQSNLAQRSASNRADAEKLFPLLREKFADGIVEEILEGGDPFLVVKPEILVDLATHCRDDEALRFDLLSLISTVDYPPKEGDSGSGMIEVVYFLDSTVHKHRLAIKLRLPRDNPTAPTLESVWRAADWHEREAFDLMGVRFVGHHNLVRILCAEDWEGHPLRKDYVIPERYHGIKNVVY